MELSIKNLDFLVCNLYLILVIKRQVNVHVAKCIKLWRNSTFKMFLEKLFKKIAVFKDYKIKEQ